MKHREFSKFENELSEFLREFDFKKVKDNELSGFANEVLYQNKNNIYILVNYQRREGFVNISFGTLFSIDSNDSGFCNPVLSGLYGDFLKYFNIDSNYSNALLNYASSLDSYFNNIINLIKDSLPKLLEKCTINGINSFEKLHRHKPT